MPALDCPHCGENRWPDPGENPKTPVISRCGNCGREVNIDELAVQTVRKQVAAAVRAGQSHIDPFEGVE